jgi:hypothetical protein
MLIIRERNRSQSNRMDCKIMTTEEEGKVFLVGNPDYCQCFEIQ